MNYDLPTRKNIRLQYYDYSQEGMYFITICIKNRIELLGKIDATKQIELSDEGKIVEKSIKQLDKIYENVIIDEYIIMPNHVHMLLIINNKSSLTISRIIKQYKMYVSKIIGYSIWQKLFYEHIIRNEKEYYRIREYIKNNIINWNKDKYF